MRNRSPISWGTSIRKMSVLSKNIWLDAHIVAILQMKPLSSSSYLDTNWWHPLHR